MYKDIMFGDIPVVAGTFLFTTEGEGNAAKHTLVLQGGQYEETVVQINGEWEFIELVNTLNEIKEKLYDQRTTPLPYLPGTQGGEN